MKKNPKFKVDTQINSVYSSSTISKRKPFINSDVANPQHPFITNLTQQCKKCKRFNTTTRPSLASLRSNPRPIAVQTSQISYNSSHHCDLQRYNTTCSTTRNSRRTIHWSQWTSWPSNIQPNHLLQTPFLQRSSKHVKYICRFHSQYQRTNGRRFYYYYITTVQHRCKYTFRWTLRHLSFSIFSATTQNNSNQFYFFAGHENQSLGFVGYCQRCSGTRSRRQFSHLAICHLQQGKTTSTKQSFSGCNMQQFRSVSTMGKHHIQGRTRGSTTWNDS